MEITYQVWFWFKAWSGKREVLFVVYNLLEVVNTIFGLRVETRTERALLQISSTIPDRRRAVEDHARMSEASPVGMVPTYDVRSTASKYSSCSTSNAPRPSEHPPVRGERMSKRLGGIIRLQKYKTSSWHLNGFLPDGSNIVGSTV